MAIQEIRGIWRAIRSGHKEAVERIASEVKAGETSADVALVDIEGVTEQAIAGSRAEVLYSHGMISKATYKRVKDAE